jgi:hypothetical protein
MYLQPINELPPGLSPFGLDHSDPALAEGFVDAQTGQRYLRLTCRHGNTMVFSITEDGALTAKELDEAVVQAANMCDRCP